MSNEAKSPKFIWPLVLLTLIALIIYNLYLGLVANEIGVPGIFTVKFAPKAEGMVPEKKGPQLNDDEVAKRQKDLQEQLDKMRDELDKQRPKPQQVQSINIAGNWYGAGNLYYIINQNGNTLTVQEVNPNLGGVSAVGRGTINQQDVDVSYRTASGTSGRALLKLSEDGRRLTGTFNDQTLGTTAPANLYR